MVRITRGMYKSVCAHESCVNGPANMSARAPHLHRLVDVVGVVVVVLSSPHMPHTFTGCIVCFCVCAFACMCGLRRRSGYWLHKHNPYVSLIPRVCWRAYARHGLRPPLSSMLMLCSANGEFYALVQCLCVDRVTECLETINTMSNSV